MWGWSNSQMRRRKAAALYELRALFAKEGCWPTEDFVYDEEHELYRRVASVGSYSKTHP